jgi:hypothetical protein
LRSTDHEEGAVETWADGRGNEKFGGSRLKVWPPSFTFGKWSLIFDCATCSFTSTP